MSPRGKVGGQPGNSNALKHGFYARHYSTSETVRLNTEISLNSEINHLRIQIDRMTAQLNNQPEYGKGEQRMVALIIAAAGTIGTLTSRRAFLFGKVNAVDGAVETAVIKGTPMWTAA